MPRTSADARPKILEAAGMVIRRDGALALTLEAVAKEAGVSKGGLLYHFPNKDALLGGLLEFYLDDFEQSLEHSGLPFAEAYVRLGSHDGSGGLLLGMMTVLALNPSLLETVRERWQRWYGRIPQHPDTVVAMLATDGIFMADILKLGTPEPALRQKTLRRMLELAQGGA
ncbi:MAG: TetR/AcrR family transcriptional regulator [Meiothermus sp.]|nr:TetR/AcrR family transcriptional regulator [Meiothermus sp.]